MNGAAMIAEILKREGTGFLSCYPRNPLIEACAALDPLLGRSLKDLMFADAGTAMAVEEGIEGLR